MSLTLHGQKVNGVHTGHILGSLSHAPLILWSACPIVEMTELTISLMEKPGLWLAFWLESRVYWDTETTLPSL